MLEKNEWCSPFKALDHFYQILLSKCRSSKNSPSGYGRKVSVGHPSSAIWVVFKWSNIKVLTKDVLYVNRFTSKFINRVLKISVFVIYLTINKWNAY